VTWQSDQARSHCFSQGRCRICPRPGCVVQQRCCSRVAGPELVSGPAGRVLHRCSTPVCHRVEACWCSACFPWMLRHGQCLCCVWHRLVACCGLEQTSHCMLLMTCQWPQCWNAATCCWPVMC